MGWLNKAAAVRTPLYGKGAWAYWKQGWNEIPEVMMAGCYGTAAFFGLMWWTHCYYRDEKYNHRYKLRYIVYRPDDERVKRVKRFEDSPPPTSTPGGLGSKC